MRRSLFSAVLYSVFCGMTLAAIGVSVAAAYGAIGHAGLAAALGLVAVVQLSILITNWRRPAPVMVAQESQEPHISRRTASTVVSQDRAGDDWKRRPEEPNVTDTTAPLSEADDTHDATSDEAPSPPGETAPSLTTGSDLLDQGRLDLYLEPVVELSETRTVYYRANLALKRQDGSRMGAYLLSVTARHGGFAPALDLALFRRTCPVIRHLKARNRRPGVFCPLSPQSFAEPGVLDELIQFLRDNKDAAARMVVEISQPDLAALSPEGMEGLARLAELGATLSLSEARLEGPEPATLVLLGFRFFDLDIAALASSHGWDAFDEDGDISRLARRAEDAGLTVLAANVARADELDRVRPFARLARGSLFSPPRVVRRDIADQLAQAAAA